MAVYDIDMYQNEYTEIDTANPKHKLGMTYYPFRNENSPATLAYGIELFGMKPYDSYTSELNYFPGNNNASNALTPSDIYSRINTGIRLSFTGTALEFYGSIQILGTFKVLIDNDVYYINIKGKSTVGFRGSPIVYKLFEVNNLPATRHEVTIMYIDVADPKCTMLGNDSWNTYFFAFGIAADGVLNKPKNSAYYNSSLDKALNLPYREYFLETQDGKIGVERFNFSGYDSVPVSDIGDGFKKVTVPITPDTGVVLPNFERLPGLGHIPSLGITLYRGGVHANVSLFGRDYAKTPAIMEYYSDWKSLMGVGGNIVGLNNSSTWDPITGYFDLVQSFKGIPYARYEGAPKASAYCGYQNSYLSGINKFWCQIATDCMGSIMTYEVGDTISDNNSIEVWLETGISHYECCIGVYINGEYRGTTDIIPLDVSTVGGNYPTMKVATISNVKKGDVIGLSCLSWSGGDNRDSVQYYSGSCVNLAFLKINNIQSLTNLSDYESYVNAKIKSHKYFRSRKLIAVSDPDKSIYNSYRARYLLNKQNPKSANYSYISPATGPLYETLNHDGWRFMNAEATELINSKCYEMMGGYRTTGTFSDNQYYWVGGSISTSAGPVGSVCGYQGSTRFGFNFTGTKVRIYSGYRGWTNYSVYIDGYYVGMLGASTGSNQYTTNKNCVFEATNLTDTTHSIIFMITGNTTNNRYIMTLNGVELDTNGVITPFNMDKCENPYFNQYISFNEQNKISSKELKEVIDDISFKVSLSKTFNIEMEYLSPDISPTAPILKYSKEKKNLNKKIQVFPTTTPSEGVINTLLSNSVFLKNNISGILRKVMFNFTGTYICIRGKASTGSLAFIVLDGEILPSIRCAKLTCTADEKLIELSGLDDREHSIMIFTHGVSMTTYVSNWITYSSVDVMTGKQIKAFNPHLDTSLTVTPKYTSQGNIAVSKTDPLPNEKRLSVLTEDSILVDSTYYQPHVIKTGDIRFSVTGTDTLSILSSYAYVEWCYVDAEVYVNGELYYMESYQNDSSQTSNPYEQTKTVEALKFTNLNPSEVYSVLIRGCKHVPWYNEGIKINPVTHIDININGRLIDYIDKNSKTVIVPTIDNISSIFSMDKYQLMANYNKYISSNPSVIEYSYDTDISSKLLCKSVEPKNVILTSRVKLNIKDILRRNQIYNQTGDNAEIQVQFSRNKLSWFFMSGTTEMPAYDTAFWNNITEYKNIPDELLHFRIKITPPNSLYIDEMVRSKLVYPKMKSDRLDAVVECDVKNARIYGHGVQKEIIAYNSKTPIIKQLIHTINGNTELMVKNTANSGVITIGNNESNVYRKYITQKIDNTSDMYMVTVVPESSSDIFSDVTADVKGEGSFKEINVPVNTFMEVKLPNFTSISKPDFLYVENNRLKGVPEIIGAYTVEVYLVTGAKAVLSINVQDMNRIY